MTYEERIQAALDKMPNDVAWDIDKRISDWLSGDGHKSDDPYIYQQVRFAENAAKQYEEVDA
ncbi:hypothetical protein BKP56_09180 [Marinilactibacillus sp. 15R]|uniref:DUF6877 family protein n=1 Tax=Marinilactibacillus sp. 15R TaxID=1911586 RepID=UPI00090B5BF3|nr:DUF6877 family protein [Marinilactibacillus sp. 15R]API89416.1 hypothetical protein BKP56_09180 [Marinilactibacillus sp. 15R]